MKVVDSAGAAVVTAIEQTMSSEVQNVELSVKFCMVIDAYVFPTLYVQLSWAALALKVLDSVEFQHGIETVSVN